MTGEKTVTERITIEMAARELRAAWLEYTRRDIRWCLGYSEPSDRALDDRIYALESVIATQMAQTPFEAMVQIALINGRASLTEDISIDGFEELHRQITQMTYSVIAFLERQHGIPRRQVCGRLYMADYLDPWRETAAIG